MLLALLKLIMRGRFLRFAPVVDTTASVRLLFRLAMSLQLSRTELQSFRVLDVLPKPQPIFLETRMDLIQFMEGCRR